MAEQKLVDYPESPRTPTANASVAPDVQKATDDELVKIGPTRASNDKGEPAASIAVEAQHEEGPNEPKSIVEPHATSPPALLDTSAPPMVEPAPSNEKYRTDRTLKGGESGNDATVDPHEKQIADDGGGTSHEDDESSDNQQPKRGGNRPNSAASRKIDEDDESSDNGPRKSRLTRKSQGKRNSATQQVESSEDSDAGNAPAAGKGKPRADHRTYNNPLRYRVFTGPTKKPPAVLSVAPAPGDLYVWDAAEAGPVGTGPPFWMYGRDDRKPDWAKLVAKYVGGGASSVMHPSEDYAVKFWDDAAPVYIAHNQYAPLAQRARRKNKVDKNGNPLGDSVPKAEKKHGGSSSSKPVRADVTVESKPPRGRKARASVKAEEHDLDQKAPALHAKASELPDGLLLSSDLSLLRGKEVPSEARLCDVAFAPDAPKVLLPFIPKKDLVHSCSNPTCNCSDETAEILEHYESMQECVETMLKSIPATYDKQCTIMNFDSSDMQLDLKVAELIAKNHIVVIRNFRNGPLLNWDRETLFDMVRSPGSIVTPHCQLRRTRYQDPSRFCTFEDFLNEAENPAVCLNLLDCQTDRFGPAWPVRRLLSHTEGLYSTMKDGISSTGVQHMSSDMTFPLQWALLSHATYCTLDHHDGNGFATWAQIHHGNKIWSWYRPHADSRADAQEKLLKNLRGKESGGARYSVWLGQGDLLIQPPGLSHRVYTVDKSIMVGGHFYDFRTLHLTEAAQELDVRSKGDLTNEEHVAVPRLLSRMAMVLPRGKQGPRAIPRRSYLALRRLICLSENYEQTFKLEGNIDIYNVEKDQKTWINQAQDLHSARIIFQLLDLHFAARGDPLPPVDQSLASYDVDGLPWDYAGDDILEIPVLPMSRIYEELEEIWKTSELGTLTQKQYHRIEELAFPEGLVPTAMATDDDDAAEIASALSPAGPDWEEVVERRPTGARKRKQENSSSKSGSSKKRKV